jgi:hypothetical protein
LIVVITPFVLWWFRGETYLSSSRRVSADVLVVEGWISTEGIKACAREFKSGSYRYVIATGGLTGEAWNSRRWNYAVEAEELLLRQGIPRDQVILAASRETGRQRTHEMAAATSQAMRAHNIQPMGINVFTRGAHARRSQLVFRKELGALAEIGVISWSPDNRASEAWWQSSERSEDMIKETVGYIFELLLNSGRKGTTARTGADHASKVTRSPSAQSMFCQAQHPSFC